MITDFDGGGYKVKFPENFAMETFIGLGDIFNPLLRATDPDLNKDFVVVEKVGGELEIGKYSEVANNGGNRNAFRKLDGDYLGINSGDKFKLFGSLDEIKKDYAGNPLALSLDWVDLATQASTIVPPANPMANWDHYLNHSKNFETTLKKIVKGVKANIITNQLFRKNNQELSKTKKIESLKTADWTKIYNLRVALEGDKRRSENLKNVLKNNGLGGYVNGAGITDSERKDIKEESANTIDTVARSMYSFLKSGTDLCNTTETNSETKFVNFMLKFAVQESGLFPFNVSDRVGQPGDGCAGLFQFENPTARDYKLNPFDPKKNTEATIKYMKQNYKNLTNWVSFFGGLNAKQKLTCVLLAHNHGAGTVRNALNNAGNISGLNNIYSSTNPNGTGFYDKIVAINLGIFAR